MVRFGVRGRRLGGVLGASWGLLGGSWVPRGATFGAQKARWTPLERAQNHAFYEVFGRFRILKRWGRPGKSGKPLGGVLGAPGDGAGAPKSVLGAYWGVLMPLRGLLGGLVGHF